MAATIRQVRYQIHDTTEPYSFPDDIIQEALDAAADFIYRKYEGLGQSNLIIQGNDPAILRIQNGVYGIGNTNWVDYWNAHKYVLDINTPIGAKIQKLMASVDLMSSLLMPTPERTPTSVSEGGLSITWGGDYQQAIDKWNEQIEKLMFSLEPPMFVMYDNY